METEIEALRELQKTKWEAHNRIHELEAENIRLARETIDRRLNAMDHFRDVTQSRVTWLERTVWLATGGAFILLELTKRI